MVARSLIWDYLQCWRRRKTSVEQDLDVTDGYESWPSAPRSGHQPDQEAKRSYAEELGPRLPLSSSHEASLLRQSAETTAESRKKGTAHPNRGAPIAGSNSVKLKPGLSPPKSQTGLYKLPWTPFLMVASRQDTFDLGGEGDDDEESWFVEDLMDLLLESEDLQRKEVETPAPTSYEDIVKARVEENRREAIATRSRARRRALVVAKVTGTGGSSGNRLSPKQQARPVIAPISGGVFEGEKLRVVTFDDRESQGVDGRALREGETDFDGERSSLLDADEEDFIENLLLEA